MFYLLVFFLGGSFCLFQIDACEGSNTTVAPACGGSITRLLCHCTDLILKLIQELWRMEISKTLEMMSLDCEPWYSKKNMSCYIIIIIKCY